MVCWVTSQSVCVCVCVRALLVNTSYCAARTIKALMYKHFKYTLIDALYIFDLHVEWCYSPAECPTYKRNFLLFINFLILIA